MAVNWIKELKFLMHGGEGCRVMVVWRLREDGQRFGPVTVPYGPDCWITEEGLPAYIEERFQDPPRYGGDHEPMTVEQFTAEFEAVKKAEQWP